MDGDSRDAPVLGEVLDWSEEGKVQGRSRLARARGPQARAEVLAWALFSAGGFVAAVVVPVNVAVLGVAFAAGWLPERALSYGRVLHLARNPIAKLYLLVVIALPLYHWAHRFRFAIHHQFGIHWKRLVAMACYGTALAGTGLTVWVLLRI
jgi:fumarate reductase iron-sulfur subunit